MKQSRLQILTEPESRQLLVEWNDTATDYPKQRCLHELVEAQVERTPHAIAVTLLDAHVTYDELNRRANQLARRLGRMGVGPDIRVGLCVERSVEMVIGILGILKAGGAYVPLDPDYPRDHLAFVLDAAQVSAVVTEQGLLNRTPPIWPESLPAVTIDVADRDEDAGNVDHGCRPEHLAYVMYTSGSTGRPKGVMVTHQNVVHSTSARSTFYRDSVDGFLLLPSLAFDASVAVIFWTLCTGGRLVLPPPGAERDPSALCRLIFRERVSHLLCVCSMYVHILERARPQELASIRVAVIGGEVCPPAVVRCHREKMPQALLFNEYGSTECTVWSSACEVSRLSGNAIVPIGRAVPNTQIYILDADLQPVPVGVAGEIYVGGDGVARGYLNRPDLTAERFIPNPFDESGSRLYRTGDLARHRTDGNIDFLGRLDRQVKIRGYRIEPEEVEAVLAQHPAVQTPVVVPLEDARGDKRLVAYVVGRAGHAPTVGDLRSFLMWKLPDFMVPAEFVFLDSLPMTTGGKVDRNGLASLKKPRPPQATGQGEPLQPLEARLRELWEQALGVQPIGIDDNFFEIGGRSLLAVELGSKIEALTDKQLLVADLLGAPTIRQLAAFLRQTHQQAWSSLVPIQPRGSRPPFFCVHSIGGGVRVYELLARHLGLDQPFYGLQAAGLEGKYPPDSRIEEMAARYVREIRRQQPDGPYFLGGHSLGGLVAFEMARRLRAGGQPVALLALFDTPNPSLSRELGDKYGRIRERTRRHLRRLVTGPDRLLYVRQRAETAARMFMSSLSHLAEQARHTKPGRHGVFDEVARVNRLACEAYVPRVYPGHLTVFRATDVGGSPDPSLGWRKLALGGIEVCQVPGSHWTVLNIPHVSILAEQLKACLDRSTTGNIHR